MGDDAGDSFVSAKVFNQSFCGFSCKALTFELRQNGIAKFRLVWGGFCEGAESADQSAGTVWMRKCYVTSPTDLVGMLFELFEKKVEDMWLPLDMRPVCGNGAADQFAEAFVAGLFGSDCFGRDRNEDEAWRNDVVTQWKRHDGIS